MATSITNATAPGVRAEHAERIEVAAVRHGTGAALMMLQPTSPSIDRRPRSPHVSAP